MWLLLAIYIILVIVGGILVNRYGNTQEVNSYIKFLRVITLIMIAIAAIEICVGIFGDHGTEMVTYNKVYKDQSAKRIFGVDWWTSKDVTYERDVIGNSTWPGIITLIVSLICKPIVNGLFNTKDPVPEEQIRHLTEDEKKKIKKVVIKLSTCALAVLLVIGGIRIVKNQIIPNGKYKDAAVLLENKQYDEAYEAFLTLGNFKDAEKQAKNVRYVEGVELIEQGKYDEAYEILEEIYLYSDTKEIIAKAKMTEAEEFFNGGKYEDAQDIMRQIDDYVPAAELYCTFAEKLIETKEYEIAEDFAQAAVWRADKYDFETSAEKHAFTEKAGKLWRECTSAIKYSVAGVWHQTITSQTTLNNNYSRRFYTDISYILLPNYSLIIRKEDESDSVQFFKAEYNIDSEMKHEISFYCDEAMSESTRILQNDEPNVLTMTCEANESYNGTMKRTLFYNVDNRTSIKQLPSIVEGAKEAISDDNFFMAIGLLSVFDNQTEAKELINQCLEALGYAQ